MNEPSFIVREVIDIVPAGANGELGAPPKRRRAGLSLALLLALLLLGLILGAAILRFALPQPRYVLVGTLADFPPASEPYPLKSERPFFIVNTGAELIALGNKPPHYIFRNCTIRWDWMEKWFNEPCGGSQFNLDGSYRSGPSPRAMDRHPLKMEGDQVWVDTTRMIEGDRVR